MPVYTYKAIDGAGKIHENKMVAVSKDDIMAILHARSQMPISITESNDVKSVLSNLYHKKVKTKDIAIFCRQFYTMNKAGVPIISCLDTIKQQATNKALALALEEVYTQLSAGVAFSEALKQKSDVFPDLLIHMAEAGDATGNLDSVMLRMANHYEKENKINAKVKGAMVYPIVLALVAIGVTGFLLSFVMPTFVGLFQDSGVELPPPTRFLLALSGVLTSYWYVILIVVVLIIFGFKWFVTTPNGNSLFDKLKLKAPLFGDLNIKIITTRFSRTMATLLSSGIPLITALEIVSRIVENKVIEKGLLQAAESVGKGSDLSGPIRSIGFFPPMINAMVKIGEESGMLDELLDQTANFYDDEVENTIASLLTILEPVLIILMAIVIGGMIIAIILPMFDMFKAIENVSM